MREFKSAGLAVRGLTTKPSRWVNRGLTVVSQLIGNGPEYQRSWINSTRNSLLIPKALGNVKTWLHMGSFTVSDGRIDGIRQAMFLDSTFHLLSLQTQTGHGAVVEKKYGDAERRAVHTMDHLFTTGEFVKRDLVEHYQVDPERVTIVGTGRGRIEPSDAPKDYAERIILFVAKERFLDKGGQVLLDGFRAAVARDPRLRLIAVVEECYRQAVESVPGATFKTAISWEELESLFNRASLFAMPAAYEPWGLVYIEALACRTPILGLNRNAFPELTANGKFGFLLQDSTPEAVAQALADAFSDLDRLAIMGASGQAYVMEKFSWKVAAERILSVLFDQM